MQKNIYIIRHCKAEGQSPDASLTDHGFNQAMHIVEFFEEMGVDRIIASPFIRAIQSVEPLSKDKNIAIEIDGRLSERVLSTKDMPDWLMKLKDTFIDFELKFEGGESSQEAMNRIVKVVEEVLMSSTENTVIVSHGNIISLLLNHYDQNYDFDSWKQLSNPDVFKLSFSNNDFCIERIWVENELEAKGTLN